MMGILPAYLLLLLAAYLLVAPVDAKLDIGRDGAIASPLPLTGRAFVPRYRRHRANNIEAAITAAAVAPVDAAVGTLPLNYDASTILSRFRGGGSGSGIEENPDYDAADADVDLHSHNDDDSSDEEDESDDKVCPKNTDEINSSTSHNPKNGNSRVRSRKATTQQPKSKSNKNSINKRIIQFTKHHQIHAYILLAIIAFRSDIFELACRYHLIPTIVDPITSQRRIKINWSTDVLKLILVVEVVRRYFLPLHHSHEDSDNSIPSSNDDHGETKNQNATKSLDHKPSTSLSKRHRTPSILPLLILLSIFLLLPRNISYFILPMFLRILLTSTGGGGGMPPDPDSPMGNLLLLLFGRGDSDLAKRMAYLPPLEQHYTFEQLNERYFRDWGAYRKALDTHSMLSAATGASTGGDGHWTANNSGGGVASLVTLITSSRKSPLPAQAPSSTENKSTSPSPMKGYYPSEYNNGTVIILDMTKLDTQASRMESIRDQINFITHYLAFTEERTPSNNEHGSDGDISMNGINATSTDAAVTNTTGLDRISNATQPISTQATPEPAVEVIVLLESPGGGVSQYGLAASHLQRLRANPNVKLTICIDSIAASGGYMMACMSSPGQLYCAPFAMVGSIGVIGQSLNVQKTLEMYGIRPYVFRGGKMKNPVGMIGDVTKEGVLAMQLMVDRIHDAFRDHVASARKEAFAEAVLSGAFPKQAGKYFHLGSSDDDDESNTEHIMDQVASGDVFLGAQAIKFGLVDRLITSDEYISERILHGARVMKLINYHRPMGLWSFFGGPSPQHRMNSYCSMVENGGLIDMFKNLVLRAASSFLAWTEQGITTVRVQGAPK